jgi:L-seryl-tRNA(Ser) seleniumtransferase
LKVHRSNFEQRGFVAEVDVAVLAEIAGAHALPLVEDLGSGTLVDLRAHGLPAESYAPARLRLGADLVCFSGDKLFGGPQAGILIGAARCIDTLRRHPLARALRIDKMTLAALDWTTDAMLDGRAEAALPVLRMLTESDERVAERAHALARRLAAIAPGSDLETRVVATRAPVGGGSLPGFELASHAVSLRRRGAEQADDLAAALRAAAVPVIGRVAGDALLLDARTLADGDGDAIAAAVASILSHS